MLKNNIKIALRSLWKQKLNTGINLLGLTLGIACASLAFVIIRHELSYDKFHDEHEQIFWISAVFNNSINLSSSPGAIAPDLQENFTEVSEVLRMESAEPLVKAGNEIFKEDAHYVDENFFSFLQFRLIQGDKKTVLSRLNTVVLSEQKARKYFGRKDPIGESLTLYIGDNEELFEVTGIIENPPSNSSIQPEILLPLKQAYKDDFSALNSWSSFPVTSLIRLRSEEDVEPFKAKFDAYVESKADEIGSDSELFFKLNALDDYHFENGMIAGGMKAPAESSYVKILAVIGLLILLVACFNYMNLSNAQGSHRLKEVGIRQVMGAKRKELIAQFLTESIVLSSLALFFSILLIEAILPLLAQVVDFNLAIDWADPSILLPLLGITLLTGLLAGAYPSVLLSRLNTVSTFKSEVKLGRNNFLTKATLTFQFVLSVGLLSCTLIMYQQQQFIKDRNLGFNKEQVLVIPTQVDNMEPADTERFVEQFRNEARKLDGVNAVASVSNSFARGNRALFVPGENGTTDLIFEYRIDPHYMDLLDIELKEGRNFSPDQDESRAMIVNEAFLKKYEVTDIASYKAPETFGWMTNAQIVGVVKDFHFLDLHSQIQPMVMSMYKDMKLQYILVKLSPEDITNTLAGLKSTWQTLREDRAFEFSFMDEDIQQQYEAESKWNLVISSATILAILIAVLGLLGLVTLSLMQRTKEISIRKIIGASLGQIVSLLSKDFMILVFISIVIAAPVAWYFMQQWLEDFAYRIDIQWWVFVVAGLAAVGIAFLTVSLQSIRAALVNPVDSLRNE